MSMAWMRMPGQSWPGAASAFLGMWVVMMVAMMLPSVAPTLWRYRQSVGARQTALVGVGYFFVWTMIGMAAFGLGVVLAAVEMRQPALARAVPIAAGVVVLVAGALQFTAWKAHHLACCRESPGVHGTLPASGAWRLGLKLGLHCGYRCAGLTAVVLVIGVMDLRAMAAVTTAITVERFAPAGDRAERVIGTAVVGTGLFMILRAAGLG